MKQIIFNILFTLSLYNFVFSNTLPKPYLFYFEYPIYINVISPILNNIYVFTTGTNNNTTKKIWICLYKDGDNENEIKLKNWIYDLYLNSPVSITFVDIGNNTSSSYYNEIRPILDNLK